MSPSQSSYLCITNNPNLTVKVANIRLIDGTILDVMIIVRDMIHLGWNLVSSPLYGNFKPNQQPYRTIVLSREKNCKNIAVNFESLSYLEEAINIYRTAPIIRKIGDLPNGMDSDFRSLDFKLMFETFRQCGILCSDQT